MVPQRTQFARCSSSHVRQPSVTHKHHVLRLPSLMSGSFTLGATVRMAHSAMGAWTPLATLASWSSLGCRTPWLSHKPLLVVTCWGATLYALALKGGCLHGALGLRLAFQRRRVSTCLKKFLTTAACTLLYVRTSASGLTHACSLAAILRYALGPIASVSAGGGFSVAVSRTGAVFSWGKWANGRLGNSSHRAPVVPV